MTTTIVLCSIMVWHFGYQTRVDPRLEQYKSHMCCIGTWYASSCCGIFYKVWHFGHQTCVNPWLEQYKSCIWCIGTWYASSCYGIFYKIRVYKVLGFMCRSLCITHCVLIQAKCRNLCSCLKEFDLLKYNYSRTELVHKIYYTEIYIVVISKNWNVVPYRTRVSNFVRYSTVLCTERYTRAHRAIHLI